MALGIFGSGGFGREVLPLVRQRYPNERIVFVVDDALFAGENLNGADVLPLSEAVEQRIRMTVAVGDGSIRRRIVSDLTAKGIEIYAVISETARIYDAVELGRGSILCDHTIITSNVRIGEGFQCNLYAYVAHDCVIGDYVTFAPRVSCNGNVVIGDGAYIGTGAVLKQGSGDRPLRIGRNAVVGMGAIVTKDVPDGVTVVGNPAKPLVR